MTRREIESERDATKSKIHALTSDRDQKILWEYLSALNSVAAAGDDYDRALAGLDAGVAESEARREADGTTSPWLLGALDQARAAHAGLNVAIAAARLLARFLP